MARLRKKHLPHRVTIVRLTGEGAEGETWAEPVGDVPAYVEAKSKLVTDRRSTSATAGTEILAMTKVFLLPGDDVMPRTKITVFPGTPREREAEVIDSAYFDYSKNTPNHTEAYCT
jgi:hypothetical protein